MACDIETYLAGTIRIAQTIDRATISAAIEELRALKTRGGRLFVLGVGGSAGNASHAVNDFRRVAGIESYAVTDNVCELTARINDEGWDSSYANWLKTSRLTSNDSILIFSIGGGSETTSLNLVRAMEYAKSINTPILSVVSRDGGKAKVLSTVCILVPVINREYITPHADSWQAVLWHLLAYSI